MKRFMNEQTETFNHMLGSNSGYYHMRRMRSIKSFLSFILRKLMVLTFVPTDQATVCDSP